MEEIELVKKSYDELQDLVIQLNTDKFILQSKIDKAIEYIENLPVMFYPDDFYEENHKEIEWNRKELLEILGEKEIEDIMQFKIQRQLERIKEEK